MSGERRVSMRVAVCAALVMAAAGPSAAFAADAFHGETLAKRWCASCHIVASDQKTRLDASAAVFRDGQAAGLQRQPAGVLPAVAASEDAGHGAVA